MNGNGIAPIIPAHSIMGGNGGVLSVSPGVSQGLLIYAGATWVTIPNWTPNGQSWVEEHTFIFDAYAIGSSTKISISADDTDTDGIIKLADDRIEVTYTDKGAVQRTITTIGTASSATEYTVRVEYSPSGVRLLALGEDITDAVNIPDPKAIDRNVIGSDSAETAEFMEGRLYDNTYTDGAFIQDGVFFNPAGNTRGVLPTLITLTGDFTYSIEIVRQDFSGTGSMDLTTGLTVAGDRIRLFDTGGMNANRVQMRLDSTTYNYDNALSDVAIGEHYELKIQKIGTNMSVYVNNELASTQAGVTQSLNVCCFTGQNATLVGVLGNFLITDDSGSGDTYEWLFNNLTESGGIYTVPNTGNTGVNYDGIFDNDFDPDINLVVVPSSSRLYPGVGSGTLTNYPDEEGMQDGTVNGDVNWDV